MKAASHLFFFNLSNQYWMDSIYSTCKQDKSLYNGKNRKRQNQKNMQRSEDTWISAKFDIVSCFSLGLLYVLL